MAKMNRGRFTLSANIILTALVITRGFSFGFIMMSFYIKYGDAILDDDVIKIANMEYAAGMPLGTAVKSVVFSFIGVFVLELITGVCGMLGVLRHSKTMLSITVIMNSLMIVIYGIYIVILSIINHKKYSLNTLATYTLAYTNYNGSTNYAYNIFPNFKRMLNCQGRVHVTTYSSVHVDDVYDCRDDYAERFSTYIEAYFGLTVTCIMCQKLKSHSSCSIMTIFQRSLLMVSMPTVILHQICEIWKSFRIILKKIFQWVSKLIL